MNRLLSLPPLAAILLWIWAAGASGAQTPVPASPALSEGSYRGFGYLWENNELGVTDDVPSPWTPIEYAAGRLKCWGREYELSPGLLPRQILTREQPLFKETPRLELIVNGKDPFSRTGSEPVFTLQAKNRCRYEIRSAQPGYTTKASVTLEYDGFLRVDIEILPEKPVLLERLVLTLPFRKSVAQFFSRYIAYDFDTESLDESDLLKSFGRLGRPVRMKFNPAVWIGDHEAGLEWTCETNRGWSPTDPEKAISIVPGRESVTMTVDVVSAPIRIGKPYRVCFALLPTPVKPLPLDWRNTFIVRNWAVPEPLASAGHRLYGFVRGFPMKYPGLPVLASPAQEAPGAAVADDEENPKPRKKIEAVSRQMNKRGIGFIPYGSLYAMPARLPGGEWKDYAPFWKTMAHRGEVANPVWGKAMGLKEGDPSLIRVCPDSKSFQDFLVWHYVQAIKEEGIGGLYFDFASPAAICRNPGHDHGTAEDPKTEYYPLFSQRRLLQRIYVACKSIKPDFLITLHHGKVPVVGSIYADVVLSGEALNRVFRRPGWSFRTAGSDPAVYVPDYSQLPEDLFEIVYSQNRGFIHMILPQIVKRNNSVMRKRPDLLEKFTLGLLARTVLYDIPVYPVRMDPAAYEKFLKACRHFGWLADATYTGPWEAGKFIRQEGGKLGVSLYRKPAQKRIMLVAANLSRQPVAETISIATGAVGINLTQGFQAVEAVGNTPYPVEGGRIHVKLQPDEILMLILRQEGPN